MESIFYEILKEIASDEIASRFDPVSNYYVFAPRKEIVGLAKFALSKYRAGKKDPHQYDEAIAYYKKILALNPHNEPAKLWILRCELQKYVSKKDSIKIAETVMRANLTIKKSISKAKVLNDAADYHLHRFLDAEQKDLNDITWVLTYSKLSSDLWIDGESSVWNCASIKIAAYDYFANFDSQQKDKYLKESVAQLQHFMCFYSEPNKMSAEAISEIARDASKIIARCKNIQNTEIEDFLHKIIEMDTAKVKTDDEYDIIGKTFRFPKLAKVAAVIVFLVVEGFVLKYTYGNESRNEPQLPVQYEHHNKFSPPAAPDKNIIIMCNVRDGGDINGKRLSGLNQINISDRSYPASFAKGIVITNNTTQVDYHHCSSNINSEISLPLLAMVRDGGGIDG